MNDRSPRIGSLLLAALLSTLLVSCGGEGRQPGGQARRLAPCTAEGSPFASRPLSAWPNLYHGTVAQVVDAHLQQMEGIASVPLQCTADETVQVERATEELRDLARSLPAWKDQAETIGEADLVPVLLEFLRIYECSLNEWKDRRWGQAGSGAVDRGARAQRVFEENRLINHEISIALPTLERTLLIVSGFDRLRPLAYGTECLKRTSLDLRNVLGLAAEASACLPRAWDTRGSLRDLAD